MKVGDVRRWDMQSDAFQGQYKLVEDLGEGRWVIEEMPMDPEEEERILEHYAHAEAHGYGTTPIWDKTWAECGEGEAPKRIGEKTHAQMLEEELARRAKRTGSRTTIRFVSHAEWAEAF